MRPRWEDARLLIERHGVLVGILPWQGGTIVANGLAAEDLESPSGWGDLPQQEERSSSGICGPLAWTAGWGAPPRPVDAGPSWMIARGGGCWIVSGLESEAPLWADHADGSRRPTGYDQAGFLA